MKDGPGSAFVLDRATGHLTGQIRNAGPSGAVVRDPRLRTDAGDVAGRLHHVAPGPADGGWLPRLTAKPRDVLVVWFETEQSDLPSHGTLEMQLEREDGKWAATVTFPLRRKGVDIQGRPVWEMGAPELTPHLRG